MKHTRRKRPLAIIFLFPLLAIAFLVGFTASISGEKKELNIRTSKVQIKKPMDNVTLGVIPQELPQTH